MKEEKKQIHPEEMDEYTIGFDGSGNADDYAHITENIDDETLSYHGTTADFDKFDISYANNGQGSQIFGDGIYVTMEKDSANMYAELVQMRRSREGEETKKIVYEVEIPDIENNIYVDWLSHDMDILSKIVSSFDLPIKLDEDYTFADIYKALASKVDGQRNASMALDEIGIVGVKANFQRTYVIFNPRKVKVINKNVIDESKKSRKIYIQENKLTLLKENLTDVIYHFTNFKKLERIIYSNIFKLSPLEDEIRPIRNNYVYYMSTTRQKNGSIGYPLYIASQAKARITLNGQLINDNPELFCKPFDYMWNELNDADVPTVKQDCSTIFKIDDIDRTPESFNKKKGSRLVSVESEDRIYSKKEFISNAAKYITRIDLINPNISLDFIMSLKDLGLINNVYVYNDIKDFNQQNSKCTLINPNMIQESRITLKENITDIVYHFTYFNNLKNIIKTDAFRLNELEDTVETEREGYEYYLSTTRQKNGKVGYSNQLQVRITLDGYALNNNPNLLCKPLNFFFGGRNESSPKDDCSDVFGNTDGFDDDIDYSTYPRTKENFDDLKIDTLSYVESEDRIYSVNKWIMHAHKYITRVDLCDIPVNKNFVESLQKIGLMDKVFFYDDYEDFAIQNKNCKLVADVLLKEEKETLIKETHESVIYHVTHLSFLQSILENGLRIGGYVDEENNTEEGIKNPKKSPFGDKSVSCTRVSNFNVNPMNANFARLALDAQALQNRGDVVIKPVNAFFDEYSTSFKHNKWRDMSEKEERIWKINDKYHDGEYLSNPQKYITRIDVFYDATYNKDSFEKNILPNLPEWAQKRIHFLHYNKFNNPVGLKENVEYEIVPSEVDLTSFNRQDNLQPEIWKNGELNPKIRLNLLDIADDFIKSLEISWVKEKDIILTGSICNFNWSDFSDIDLHVVIDYNDVSDKTEFVKAFFDAKKNQWNERHTDLEMFGFPVELYVQDVNEDAISSGVYSLEQNKWIKEPSYNDMSTDKLDRGFIKEKAAAIMTYIDDIEDRFNATTDKHQLEELDNEIQHLTKKLRLIRTKSLDKGGEMDNGNVIYKVLRRSEYLDKIWKISDKIYDKINSINEGRIINEGFRMAKYQDKIKGLSYEMMRLYESIIRYNAGDYDTDYNMYYQNSSFKIDDNITPLEIRVYYDEDDETGFDGYFDENYSKSYRGKEYIKGLVCLFFNDNVADADYIIEQCQIFLNHELTHYLDHIRDKEKGLTINNNYLEISGDDWLRWTCYILLNETEWNAWQEETITDFEAGEETIKDLERNINYFKKLNVNNNNEETAKINDSIKVILTHIFKKNYENIKPEILKNKLLKTLEKKFLSFKKHLNRKQNQLKKNKENIVDNSKMYISLGTDLINLASGYNCEKREEMDYGNIEIFYGKIKFNNNIINVIVKKDSYHENYTWTFPDINNQSFEEYDYDFFDAMYNDSFSSMDYENIGEKAYEILKNI